MARERMESEVLDIESRVAEMAEHAKGMLRDGVASLARLDRSLAQDVVARQAALAELDDTVETDILRFLALQAPVAKDMRRMGAALKLITYLNRIGRYGYDIAHVTRDWPEGREHVTRIVNLREMAGKVEAMLDVVLQGFEAQKAPDLDVLMELENDVDAMRFSVWREALTYMAQDPHNIEVGAHYMMVARYLERCGDNVCKMAEKVLYAATGQRTLLH